MSGLEPGFRLSGRFRLVRPVDDDGRTTLWLAEDDLLGGTVALRILAPSLDSASTRARLREACARARRLAHPNVVSVFDYHETGGHGFVSRAWVEAEPLWAHPSFSVRDVTARLLGAVDGLLHAHGEGVAHGDLKPSKILCLPDGTTKLADVGLASALREALDDHAAAPSDDLHALGTILTDLLGDESSVPDELRTLAARLDREPSMPLSRVREILSRHGGPAAPSARAGPPAPAGPKTVVDGHGPSEDVRDDAAPPRSNRPFVYAGLAASVAAILAVFFLLPGWVDRRPTPDRPAAGEWARPATEADEEADAPRAATSDDARPRDEALADESARAERALGEVLAARAALVERSADRWAPDELARVDESIAAGDRALLGEDHTAAATAYEDALARLTALRERSSEILSDALEAGASALAREDGAEAREAFARALAIDAGNEDAESGLARAERLDEVIARMEEARALEGRGDLSGAVARYHEALALDDAHRPAIEAIARVETAIADDAFEADLAAGLDALAAGDLDQARTRLVAARDRRPESEDARDGLRRLRERETARTLAGLRRRAEAFEAREEWRAASEQYRKANEIDPSLVFAKDGLARSRRRARLLDQARSLNDDPTRLFRPEGMARASALLAEYENDRGAGARLEEEMERLRRSVGLAKTPIPVTLESDEETEVVIQRRGSLGSFAERTLSLPPGTYTIQGRRDGYRDVLQTVTLVPGRPPPRIVVRCVEQI